MFPLDAPDALRFPTFEDLEEEVADGFQAALAEDLDAQTRAWVLPHRAGVDDGADIPTLSQVPAELDVRRLPARDADVYDQLGVHEWDLGVRADRQTSLQDVHLQIDASLECASLDVELDELIVAGALGWGEALKRCAPEDLSHVIMRKKVLWIYLQVLRIYGQQKKSFHSTFPFRRCRVFVVRIAGGIPRSQNTAYMLCFVLSRCIFSA